MHESRLNFCRLLKRGNRRCRSDRLVPEHLFTTLLGGNSDVIGCSGRGIFRTDWPAAYSARSPLATSGAEDGGTSN